jgi:hypothetical protein
VRFAKFLLPTGSLTTFAASCNNTANAAVVTPAPGSLTQGQLVQYFEQAHWSTNAAAGIVGNMSQEDPDLNPTTAGGGLVQNIGSMWQQQVTYDQQHSLDPMSEAGQLEFLAWYVPRQSWWAQFNGAASPQDAALWFQNNYEQCSGAGARGTDQQGGGLCNPANRQGQAVAALQAAGGKTGPVYVSGGCQAGVVNANGYANPVQKLVHLLPERIDMGVDYSGTGPILALGNGKIDQTTNSGWPGGGFIEEKLTDGQYAGKYWYEAECIAAAPGLKNGSIVQAGQMVGTVTNCGSGIEIGWSIGDGGTTLAASLHQQSGGKDAGGWSTVAGASASRLLVALGAPAGVAQSGGLHGQLPVGYP